MSIATGSGTQADPYIIQNWSEFIEAVGMAGVYVEFPKTLTQTSDTEVNPNKLYMDSNGVVQTNVQNSDLPNLYENSFVLDANNYMPNGITTTITFTCADLNGYGGTIKNLASQTTDLNILTLASTVHMSQIAFLNIDCNNCNFIAAYYNNDLKDIEKCIFSGRVDCQSTHYFENTRMMTYRSCAFNVELYNNSKFTFANSGAGYAHFRYCRINTEDYTSNTSSTQNVEITNSYWTGNSISNIYVTMDSYDYTVFDLTCSLISATNGAIKDYTFVNSDKCSDTSGAVGVTTAQLSDATYLASLGFPIQI